MMIKKRKKLNNGFSLAEMMIVLLIMSIVAIAMVPLIIQKAREDSSTAASGSPLWSASTSDANDIYPTLTSSSSAQVLLNSASDDNSAKLVTNSIAFNSAGTNFGTFNYDNSMKIGISTNGTFASGGGIAIGNGANLSAIGSGSVALGNSTAGSADGSVAIGGSTANDTSSPSVAIGAAHASGESVALGSATASSYSFAANRNANASSFSQAYGVGTSASNSSIAIGAGTSGASATSESIAVGAGANTTGSNAVAIGSNASAASNSSVFGSGTYQTCYFNGTVLQSGHSFSPSDRRLKNVQSMFNSGLDVIDKFKTYNYTFKADKKKTPHVGVMAQDLQKIFPNAISKNSKGYLSIRQDEMFYVLINSIKQLHKVELNVLSRMNSAKLKLNKFANLERTNTSKLDNLVKENEKLQVENIDIERRIAKLEKKVR